MIKTGAFILATLTLTACATEPAIEWTKDCDRYFSEKSGSLIECKAENAAKAGTKAPACANCTGKGATKANTGLPAVTETAAGVNDPGFNSDDKERDSAHVE